jgi:hypothetical protein
VKVPAGGVARWRGSLAEDVQPPRIRARNRRHKRRQAGEEASQRRADLAGVLAQLRDAGAAVHRPRHDPQHLPPARLGARSQSAHRPGVDGMVR